MGLLNHLLDINEVEIKDSKLLDKMQHIHLTDVGDMIHTTFNSLFSMNNQMILNKCGLI